MMKKVALLAYNGELTCFAHVMLYALDFEKKGYEVKVVIEGAATSLIAELAKPDAPFANLYSQLRDKKSAHLYLQGLLSEDGESGRGGKTGLGHCR